MTHYYVYEMSVSDNQDISESPLVIKQFETMSEGLRVDINTDRTRVEIAVRFNGANVRVSMI